MHGWVLTSHLGLDEEKLKNGEGGTTKISNPKTRILGGKDQGQQNGEIKAPGDVAIEGKENIPNGALNNGVDMGGHNQKGEPMPQNHEANKQEELATDNDSILSAEPPEAAKEVAQDVGGGLGRTAEAFARLPMVHPIFLSSPWQHGC